MKNSPRLVVTRNKASTILFAPDELEFYKQIADAVGSSISSVVRNAALVAFMDTENPVELARDHHVTELARIDKWRRDRESAQ